jgi:hypothetical protein
LATYEVIKGKRKVNKEHPTLKNREKTEKY